ncbi:MAG TPA: pyrroloquinoline quinone biosynthesis protein PqqB [Geminicoccaceae bacterium]|nr:pyrroloquinoline quinone biosynthesis protein PqqB [Geminicoccaceae bacterium]
MRIIVLGSAAGGGFPQWNCNCANCQRARSGDPAARSRTQCSLAVSADGERWFLLNASPDLRQQLTATPALHPRPGSPRHSPVEGVVLTNGDIDHIAGLLCLRESHQFSVYATRRILTVLDHNPVFNALDRDLVDRRPVGLDEPITLGDGLSVEMFAVPGKVALYLEEGTPPIGGETEDVVGVRVGADGGRSFFFVPGCARLTAALARRLTGAPVVFFDGTLWQDDEMVRLGAGSKTGQRMGHMSVSGSAGSLAAFAGVEVGRKIYVHINNTNPILLDGSPERAVVTAAGWEVAYDGMEIELPCRAR